MQPLPVVEELDAVDVTVEPELVAEPVTLPVDPELDVPDPVSLVVAIAPPIDTEAVVEVAPAPPPPCPLPYGLSERSAQPLACTSAKAATVERQARETRRERFMSGDLPSC